MATELPARPIHIALILLLAFLCYEGHQLTRHLVGAGICGGFSTMTFTVTTTREPCSVPLLVAASGPVFTYGLAYAGMLLLRTTKHTLFAYALIFASFSHLRWIQTLTGRGDELVLGNMWNGTPSRLLVAVIVFLVGVPPIWVAYRTIANRQRMLTFVCSWLLPLPVLALLLFSNRYLFGESGAEIHGPLLLGIPPVVVAIDLLAAVAFLFFAPRYWRQNILGEVKPDAKGKYRMSASRGWLRGGGEWRSRLGGGKRLFGPMKEIIKLETIGTRRFDHGVVCRDIKQPGNKEI